MSSLPLRASAPAKLLLLGSYAVLEGEPALVVAWQRRLCLSLDASESPSLSAPELGLPSVDWPLHPAASHPAAPGGPLQLLSAALGELRCRASTDSQIPKGLGSSAALLAAACGARLALEQSAIPKAQEVFDLAYRTLGEIVGRGSGADLAAAVFGGALSYQRTPTPQITPLPSLPHPLELSVWRRPLPLDTGVAITRWRELKTDSRVQSIGDAARAGIEAWSAGDGEGLARAMNQAHEQQQALGAVGPDEAWLEHLAALPRVLGLVSTGAGGSEAVAVLTLGPAPVECAPSLGSDVQVLAGGALGPGLEVEL